MFFHNHLWHLRPEKPLEKGKGRQKLPSRVYSSVVEHLTTNQAIPEIPHWIHFPPHNYWEQLRVEHQEHSITLQEIREDQRAMREEQQRQGRDIEELKDIIGSSRRKRHHY